jgi:hypothetical protein
MFQVDTEENAENWAGDDQFDRVHVFGDRHPRAETEDQTEHEEVGRRCLGAVHGGIEAQRGEAELRRLRSPAELGNESVAWRLRIAAGNTKIADSSF